MTAERGGFSVMQAMPFAEGHHAKDRTGAAAVRIWPGAQATTTGPELLSRANAAVSESLVYLRQLVEGRRRHPGDPEADVLKRLLQGDAEGVLSQTEWLHNRILLLNAGHETTTNLIGNGLHALLRHRGELERLAAEPALITAAVEERLRFETPLQQNKRRLTADAEVGGQTVPACTFVALCLGAANRDPTVLDDPDRLDLAHKPNNHLAFGQGAHASSGMNVARLEARIAIGRLRALPAHRRRRRRARPPRPLSRPATPAGGPGLKTCRRSVPVPGHLV